MFLATASSEVHIATCARIHHPSHDQITTNAILHGSIISQILVQENAQYLSPAIQWLTEKIRTLLQPHRLITSKNHQNNGTKVHPSYDQYPYIDD